MTTHPSKNQLIEQTSAEAEIIEQTPVISPKNRVLTRTRHAVERLTGVFALGGALTLGTPALATSSPFLPLADASGKPSLVLKEDPKMPDAKTLEARGFSRQFASEVTRFVRENREGIARGELPNEPDYTISLEPLAPIRDENTMKALDTEGRPLTRADEKALGLPEILDGSTLSDILSRIFEGDTKSISRYTKRITKLQSTPNGGEALTTLFMLYNEGKKTIIYPSRESYRHLFVTSYLIASSIFSSPEEQVMFAPLVMTQGGEYLLLTDPKIDTIMKIKIGGYEYLIVPPESMSKNTNLSRIPAMSAFFHVADMSIDKMRTDIKGITKTGESIIALAQKEGVLTLSTKIESIAASTTKLIKEYVSHPNSTLRSQIDANMESLQDLQQQIHRYDRISSKDFQETIRIAEKLIGVVQAFYMKSVVNKK